MGPRQLRTSAPPRYATRGIGCGEEKRGKTPPLQMLMSDSRLNEAERGVQPPFIKSLFFNAILVGLPVLAFQATLKQHRPSIDLSPARVAVTYAPLPAECAAPVTCRAWTVGSADRRVSGLSGLAMDGGRLLAITDSGLLVWLDPPGTPSPTATIRALPAVPGRRLSKLGRDSEAIARDPSGGWWVAFEQQHVAMRYDAAFERLVETRPFPIKGFSPNRGVEALAVRAGRLRWWPESSGVSDAAVLPDGRVALLERRIGALGFSASVGGLGASIRLPTGPFDNGEGIAIAPRPDGGTRLWIVTDNDGSRMRATKLLAVDLPPPR